MTSKQAAAQLIGLLRKDGPRALSLQGPNRTWIDEHVKALATAVVEQEGHDGLKTTFDRVERWLYKHLDELQASAACSAIDHRFDSVAGWYA
jgi:hypothetical protein